MGETLSAQVVPMVGRAGTARGDAPARTSRVVTGGRGSVKAERTGAGAEVDLLRPAFETDSTTGPRLWLQRLLWRRRLQTAFHAEAETVLDDFGLSPARLEDYLARPFWRA